MLRVVRLLLVALAAVSMAAAVATVADGDPLVADDRAGSLVDAATRPATVSARIVEQVTRMAPAVPMAASWAFVWLTIVLVARSRGTIGEHGTRRLTDAGDAWRSLLLGAPPAGR